MAPEVSERALHSAQSLYIKLLEAFPNYAADFDTKWQRWQQAISPTSEFVCPGSSFLLVRLFG